MHVVGKIEKILRSLIKLDERFRYNHNNMISLIGIFFRQSSTFQNFTPRVKIAVE